ncbi:MAG: hypothetical protein ACT4ON_06345 [Bacteroidota bacterium]
MKIKSAVLTKLSGNELLIKISLIIALFLGTFLVYKMLQKPRIYNATLKNITHTYNRDAVLKHVVWKVNEPYYYIDEKNSVRWDAKAYSGIRENYYNGDDSKYAFFPLFPLLWEFLHINAVYIGFFNYLLFGLSVLILSSIFFKNLSNSVIERLCVFTISLTLPPVIIFYMPYADAIFIFTFALAVYGLIKNKYWLFFISILLFAMARPVFVIVGLSFVIIDLLYFIKHRNILHFVGELSLKLIPLLLGTGVVFFMFYLNSGSFTKYFEAIHTYWNVNFSIPKIITDWSIEGYGMSVFAIFFIVIPSLVLFLFYFLKYFREDKTNELPSIFKGNVDFIKTYLFNNSIVYFWGVFLFIIFFQAGALNGLSRYIIASPFFFIFLFVFYTELKKFKLSRVLFVFIALLAGSFILLTNQKELDPTINFNDSGFITLLLSFIYLFSLRFINDFLKVSSLLIVSLYNIIWITYLYNVYLCDGWIFT